MRVLFTILLAGICAVSVAQKKPKINQAESALEEGNLAEAKTIVDQAIVHEKTKDDPKTWFVRGQVYAALDTANNEEGALEESINSFNKTIELDPEQKSINTIDFNTGTVINVDTKLQGYYAYYYNQGIASYNEKNFGSAADKFETAFFIMPSDTSAILNAAYAAVQDQDVERAKADFNKAYDAGVRDKSLFLQLYNYAVTEKAFEEGLVAIRKGRDTYPNDIDLMKYEINLLIQLQRIDEAKENIEKAIEADPSNADLLFSLGVLKEETGDVAGAMEAYDKALEVDPNHYNSNFNKAVYIFNEANKMMKERNALSYKESKKIDALTTKINVQLKEALPLWEKLYSLNNTDQTVLETLGYIYTNLKMYDKAEKIADELDALAGN